MLTGTGIRNNRKIDQNFLFRNFNTIRNFNYIRPVASMHLILAAKCDDGRLILLKLFNLEMTSHFRSHSLMNEDEALHIL